MCFFVLLCLATIESWSYTAHKVWVFEPFISSKIYIFIRHSSRYWIPALALIIILCSNSRLCTGSLIYISHHFVIIDTSVDHRTYGQGAYNSHTNTIRPYACTRVPWNCTHAWHTWDTCCIELVGALYCTYIVTFQSGLYN